MFNMRLSKTLFSIEDDTFYIGHNMYFTNDIYRNVSCATQLSRNCFSRSTTMPESLARQLRLFSKLPIVSTFLNGQFMCTYSYFSKHRPAISVV